MHKNMAELNEQAYLIKQWRATGELHKMRQLTEQAQQMEDFLYGVLSGMSYKD